VQRLIVEQINQVAGQGQGDQWAGQLTYDKAPWFDWGPYLWADGPNQSAGTGLFWCDNTTNTQIYPQCLNDFDFRFGDITDDMHKQMYWGDHTHPTYQGQAKVAGQLVKFIRGTLGGPQAFISDWVTPWIKK
jgi:hypothetical protein